MDETAGYHRHARITPMDQGPLVNIAAWICMCTTVLFTSFRLLSNVLLRGHMGMDDWAIIVTTAIAAGQTVAMSYTVKHGIGLHQDTLSDHEVDKYQQAILASSILYVCTLAFSKFSLLLFLSRLIMAPQKTMFQLFMRLTWAVMLLYLISEVFALSFQCNTPRVYDYINGQCINLLAFWDFDTIFDVLSSLMILALPIIIVKPLHMQTFQKFQAVSAFGFQIPACAFAIVRLVYLHRAFNSPDHTWKAVDWQVWTAINMHFNVIAANIPCLKIFLDGFQSTLFHASQDSILNTNTASAFGSRISARFSRKNKSKTGNSKPNTDEKTNGSVPPIPAANSATGSDSDVIDGFTISRRVDITTSK